MTFKDGDFLEVDYSMWSASDNELMATTEEQRAKAGGVYDKDFHYGPALVILGTGGVIKGLDSALRTMSVSESKKFTLKPEDAFGERNEDLVRVMPIAEFRKNDVKPYPGMRVRLDDAQAVVRSVEPGRVVVDANHPYAGREVVYEVKVVRVLNSDNDKIAALGRSYGVSPTSVNSADKTASISFSDSVKKDADYFIGKANLVASVFSNLKSVEKVRIEEEYLRPKEKKEEKSKEEQQ
jgi:peptidylprolyl isomerase